MIVKSDGIFERKTSVFLFLKVVILMLRSFFLFYESCSYLVLNNMF